MEKISVVVPCYNEEKSLPFFYDEMKKEMKKMSNSEFELIFVNDGSKDKTIDVIKEFARNDKRVRFLSFSRNFGKEAAMYAGFKEATGDYVSVMDADLQDPPELLENMLKYII